MERQIAALLCRTSERRAGAAAGTRELAELLGARIIGSPGEPHEGDHRADLRHGHGCLLEAGGQVDDALEAGHVPILLAPECSVCVSTLPVAAGRRPDLRVLWLDAHPDFNTPATSASGYLAGMCLAGACGLWDTGFGGGLDPARVIMFGVRDVEGGERVALDRGGVHRLGDPEQLQGMELFVHLDLDVLDPATHPASFPAPGGLEPDMLRELLAYVADECSLVGAEITAAEPGYAQVAADAIAPLLA